MNITAQILADSFVSLAAFLGLCIFISLIAANKGANPLARRTMFGMAVLALLMASRVLFWITDFGLFRFLTMSAAGFIPLAALLLAEGLLRRHAPPFLKILASGGAALFVFMAFLPSASVDPARAMLLFAFQFTSLLAIGWIVARRDKSLLSASENRAVERMAMSLLVILPLLVTDYQIASFRLPVRLGGVGILFLCWLGISLSRSTVNHRDMLKTFVMLTSSAFVAAVTIGLLADLSATAILQAMAVVLSASLLAAVYNDSLPIGSDERRDSLLRHLAKGDISSSERFLRALQDHPLLKGALLLRSADLDDFDMMLLKQLFADEAVRAGTEPLPEQPAEQREQLNWLFEKFEATHILLVREEPFTLLAMTMPQLTETPGALTELQAVQRMAILISRQEAAR